MDRGFDDLSHAYSSTQLHRRNRETSDFVEWIGPQPGDSALDVASGPGTIARALAPRVKRTIALDLSHSMLLEAKMVGSPAANLHLTGGDIAALPFHDRVFDLLTCAYVFANLRNLPLILRECVRVVARSGRLAFMDVIASENSDEHEHLNRLESMRSEFYTRIRAQSELLDEFRQSGLQVEKSM